MARMPGRVESVLLLPDPTPNDDDPRDFNLAVRVARDGKIWPVSWGFWEVGDAPEAINWKPLREASIDIKLYVIPQLPRLIVQMAEEQEKLKARIERVADEFEAMASKLGMTKEAE